MEFTIRPVKPDDGPALNAIRIRPEVGRFLLALPTERVEFTRSFLEEAGPSDHIFVAERAGQVLGMATLQQCTQARRKHAAELGIFVQPEAQGQGVGAALMDALLDLADNWLLLDRVELSVFTENERARALYEKRGFAIEARAEKLCVLDGALADEFRMARLRPGLRQNTIDPVPPGEEERSPLPGAIVRIRPRCKEDHKDIAELQSQQGVYETFGTLPSLRESVLDTWYDGLDRFAQHMLVAELMEGAESGKVVGLINLNLHPNPRLAQQGDLLLAVHSAYQNRGIGRQLLEAILRVADEWMALRRLELMVSAHNTSAQQLYRSLGFREEGRYRCYYSYRGGYSDQVAMARFYTPPPAPRD